jgi:anti-sigma factor ChrR (cupin superfamily)
MKPSIALDTNPLPWRPTPYEGVSWKKLYFGDEGSSVLLRFEPGAAYGAHRHPAGEQYFVLEGSVVDGGQTWGAGAYVRHAAGSAHRPRSDEGCLLFVTLPAPIELVSPEA